MKGRRALLALVALVTLSVRLATEASAATITIQVTDAVGEGFNDTTVFVPMGGNTATTLGQARRNVFNEAARLWGLLINSPVTIVVEASFDPLTCSATTGVLGSAGPTWIFHDFVGSPLPGVFYPAALADALHGSNIVGKNSNGTPFGDTDIRAQFNSAINGDATCLQGGRFYYGFDHQLSAHRTAGPFVADLLGVVLHELGHGLGFLSIVDQSGVGIADSGGTPLLGVFDQFVYDENSAMFWPQMSAAQRATSQAGLGGGTATALTWNAPHVNSNLGRETSGVSSHAHLLLYAPATYDATSSVSHWDNTATPDLLMEPSYSLRTGNHTDLTVCVLYDLGWGGGHCPDQLNALPLSLTAHAGTALNITLAASNTSGGALSYSIALPPAHGTLTAPSGATLSYTPASGYLGADQFSYRVAEAGVSSDAAVVAIDVQAAVSSGSGGGSGGGSASGATTAAASGGGGGGAFDGRSLLLLLVAVLVGLAARDRHRRLRRRAVIRRR